MLRRHHLDMLAGPGGDRTAPNAVLGPVYFCKWQLECGQRGWTADPLREIARRWNIGVATASRHRVRLEALGLLKVVKRSNGRLSDLVWLNESFECQLTTWTVDVSSAAMSASQTDSR